MFKLDGSTLKLVCPNLNNDRAILLAALITEIAPKYDISSAGRLHEFIAQLAHESGEFTIKTESMTYTTPSRIASIWPSRFNLTGTDGKLNANNYIRNAEKLANTVYADRMGNGDFASGDGFRYRGGGYLQLTGKESYEKYTKYLNLSADPKLSVAEVSNLVHATDRYALDSAFWEFSRDKSLNDEADRDEFITITKRINGGVIGLAERQKYYERAKRYIKDI